MGVLKELLIEVVEFNEKRTPAEVAHNTLIKDIIRRIGGREGGMEGGWDVRSPEMAPSSALKGTSIASNIVNFLTSSAVNSRPQDSVASERCLRCLSGYVGWVDVGLIGNEATLTILYQSLKVNSPA